MADLAVTLRISADAGGVVSTLQRVSGAQREIGQGARSVQTEFRATGQASVGLSGELSRLRSGALGAAAALGGIATARSLAKDIVHTTSALTGLGQAMSVAVGPRAAQEMAFVRSESERLGLEVISTAGAYTRLTAATRGTNLEGQQTREIFTSVAQASRVLNLSVEQTEGTLRALEQMISKGTVQAEELKGQLSERLPGAFRIAAEAMGVTQAQLNKLLDTGQVTAEDLLPRLSDRLDELYGAGARAAAGLPSAEFTRLQNAVTDLEAAIGNAGFMQSLAEGARALTDALRQAVESGAIEVLVAGLGALATVAAVVVFSRLAQGAATYMAEMVKARAAQSAFAEMVTTTDLRIAASGAARAATEASNELQSARAAERRAAAQLAEIDRTMQVIAAARAEEIAKLSLARADIAAAERQLAAASATQLTGHTLRLREEATDRAAAATARINALTTEMAALGRAQAGVSAQQTAAQISQAEALNVTAAAAARADLALAASTTAQGALAANTAANATRMGFLATTMGLVRTAGSSLFALMGGWVTVALGAAYGVYYLATRQTEAEQTSDRLSDAMDRVRTSAGGMRAEAIRAAEAEMRSTEQRIEALQREIALRERSMGAGIGERGEMRDLASAAFIDSARTKLAQLEPLLVQARGAFEAAKRGMTLADVREEFISDATDMVASIDRFVPAASVLKAFGIEVDVAGAKTRAAFSAQQGVNAFVEDLTRQIDTMRERIADLQGGAEAVARLKLADLKITDPAQAKAVDALIGELAGLERQYKGMQAAPRELRREVKETTTALREQGQALEQLERIQRSLTAEVATPAQRAWMDYEDTLGDIAEATEVALAASRELGAEGESIESILQRQDAAARAAAVAYDQSASAIERQAAAQRAANDVVGRLLGDLEEEARLSAMTSEQRRIEEIVLRAVADAKNRVNEETGESLALSPAEIVALRQKVAAQLELIDTNQRAQRSIEDNQRAWEDFSYGLADALLAGGRQTSDYLKRLLDDLKRQILGSGIHALFRSIFGIGTANGGPQSMLGAMFGGGGGGSGLFGNLLGGGGNNAGALGSMLFGGGSGFTGLMNLFRGGTISSSMGIQQVNAITGAQGASGGAGSIFGGGMLQNGFSMGGMMGAGGGIMMGLQGIRTGNALQGAAGGAMAGMSIGGPWGALIGGIIGGLGALIRGNKPPDFRVGGTQASVRNPEGGFETVFGRVRAGSREISWESLVQPMQQFDQAIADMVQSFGMGQQQMDSIRAALARWSVDLKGDAATAEGVLGSRFGAILSTFSQDVQDFVGGAGTVQERVGRLADALAIEDIVDVGALGDSFGEVSALLGEYRQGTEAITDTYARVLGSVTLLDQALALSGTTLDMTRGELIRFAADITDAAGGLERAQQLWGGYYATFYTETERAQVQLAQATERASALFAAANLDLAQYTGDGGAAAFRDMFERLLPTLSAEAVVQYLEMAEALGLVIDLTGQASGSVSQLTGTLAELMESVTDRLADSAPPLSFADRLRGIGAEIAEIIARAEELGATEAQLSQIRLLGQREAQAILAEQADAYRQYADLVRGLADEAADLRGLTEYQREMREIDRWTRSTADALNAAARAAGMQAAAEEDLALMHEVAAARAAAAMARLAQRGRDIVEQLGASRLTQIDTQMGEVGTAVGTWMSQAAGGMDQVTQATDNAVQALIGAQQRVRDWLNGIMASELSGLRPKDRLTELLALAERTRVAAAGGDAEAMARMPQLADEILRLGRDVYASGSQYFDLRDMVRGWMQGLADIVIPTPEPGTSGGGGGGGGGGGLGGGIVDGTLEQQQQASAQAAAERRALWMELVAVIRDMMSAPDQTLQGIEETLGFSMRDLVTELGVNLSDMTVATASQLAGIAQAMGVELTDLASNVGVSLGSLGDRQSLLNDALESTIATLPAGQRDLLEPLLRDVEEAAALGDTAGVEAGISDMEDAIAEMAPDIRDLLAPYFSRIAPADPATELSHLATMETTLGSSLSELQAQTLSLAAIEGLLAGGGVLPTSGGQIIPVPGLGGGNGVPPPGYAVGTSYVPSDGLAYLHQGEMVLPAAVSDFFRREGIPFSVRPRAPVADTNTSADPAVTALLRELVQAARESRDEAKALRDRVASLEATLARESTDHLRSRERQTDAIRGAR